jgi:fructose-1,6-bisphosphatase/inositol monophosphatase family enzyme
MTKKILQLLEELSDVVSLELRKEHEVNNLGEYVGDLGLGGDKTKRGDAIAEQVLKKVLPQKLEKYQIGHAILVSEETGKWECSTKNVQDVDSSQDIFLIVDPIDGSNNLRPHYTPKPQVAFSVACGLVHDLNEDGGLRSVRVALIKNIFSDDTYTAILGEGSFLNGVPLKSSGLFDLNAAILGTSLDHGDPKLTHMLENGLSDLLGKTQCQRRIGSTILDLCQVATGDYDAYVSTSGGIKVHDFAAVQLIMREAGCHIVLRENSNNKWQIVDLASEKIIRKYIDFSDKSTNFLQFQLLVAGNKELLNSLKNIIRW